MAELDLGEAALRRGAALQIDAAPGYAALVSTVAGVYAERGDLMRAQVILDDLIERLAPARVPARGEEHDRERGQSLQSTHEMKALRLIASALHGLFGRVCFHVPQ